MNEFYIVLKLTSGEQVMSVLKEEDERHILISNPMIMKTTIDFEAGKERITAAPLCPFSDDESYVLDKKDILFIKKLHHVFVDHYKNIVKDYKDSTNFVPAGSAEALDWGDEPPTPEEARSAIAQLKNILGEEEEIDWADKLKRLVPGNDTLN